MRLIKLTDERGHDFYLNSERILSMYEDVDGDENSIRWRTIINLDGIGWKHKVREDILTVLGRMGGE